MSTTKPQRDLVHLLSRAEHLAVRRLATALDAEAAGCSVDQWRALAFLADGAGRTMTELADYALLPAPTATKLIDRLVADNLVYRHPDPTDRRRVLVHLTERGLELHKHLAAALDRMQADLLQAVDGGPDLEDLLDRLADTLDQPATHTGRVAI
jgi:DNA-binding MarR family transcriptional regulator